MTEPAVVLAEERKLNWARGALTALVLIGVFAIAWAAWTVTRTTIQSTSGSGAAAVPTPAVDSSSNSQDAAEHAAEHEAGLYNEGASETVVVDESATDEGSSHEEASTAASQGRQVGTLIAGWDEPETGWQRWGPVIIDGPREVSFSVTVEVSDGGGETFGIADSTRGISGVRGGTTERFEAPAGEFIIEQQLVNGWPLPTIVCDGADPVMTDGVAVLDLVAGAAVDCTFFNERDADSLSVVDTAYDCAWFTGRVLGPKGPFWITYSAEGPRSASGSFPLLDVGTVRVEEPGLFITPLGLIEAADLVVGDYPIWIRVHDDDGGRVPLLDAITITVGGC